MNTKKCTNCGVDIPVEAAFCNFCGAAQQSQQAPPQPEQAAPNYQQVPPQPPYGQTPYEQKSKLAAGLLGIFLGGLGIHNFYLGYQNRGLIQLLVSLLTCGIGAVPMSIWGLIEGIQILTGSVSVDANNVPLKD